MSISIFVVIDCKFLKRVYEFKKFVKKLQGWVGPKFILIKYGLNWRRIEYLVYALQE